MFGGVLFKEAVERAIDAAANDELKVRDPVA